MRAYLGNPAGQAVRHILDHGRVLGDRDFAERLALAEARAILAETEPTGVLYFDVPSLAWCMTDGAAYCERAGGVPAAEMNGGFVLAESLRAFLAVDLEAA